MKNFDLSQILTIASVADCLGVAYNQTTGQVLFTGVPFEESEATLIDAFGPVNGRHVDGLYDHTKIDGQWTGQLEPNTITGSDRPEWSLYIVHTSDGSPNINNEFGDGDLDINDTILVFGKSDLLAQIQKKFPGEDEYKVLKECADILDHARKEDRDVSQLHVSQFFKLRAMKGLPEADAVKLDDENEEDGE